jgi:hypothetical protein
MKALKNNINRIIVLCLSAALFFVFSCEKDDVIIIEPLMSFQISISSNDSKLEYPDSFKAKLEIEVIDGNTITDSIDFIIQDSSAHRSKGNIEVPIDKRFVLKVYTAIEETELFAISDTLEITSDIEGAKIVKMILTRGIIVIGDPQFSSITITTVILSSEIEDNGGYKIESKGFTIIEDGPTATADDEIIVSGSNLGSFQTSVNGLISGTTYNVRAFASNGNEYVESNERSFTTPTTTGTVNLITNTATAITTNSSNVSGAFLDDGAQIFIAKGIIYATFISPDLMNNEGLTDVGAGNTDFESSITGLLEDTQYYAVAYATNENGDSFFGNEITFNTLPFIPPTVTTPTINDIFLHTVLITGEITSEGTMPITAKGVVCGQSPNPTLEINDAITDEGGGVGDFSSQVTGLETNISYFARAYAVSEAGVGYGNEISFTTIGIGGNGPAGGIVFYDDGVSGGMEVAVDSYEVIMQWGCATLQTNTINTFVGSGHTNTDVIVAFHNDLVDYALDPTQCSGTNDGTVAAWYCDQFELNGHIDWFLPSEDELNLIYTNLHVVGYGNFTDDYYWSSTEVTDIRARALDFWKGLYIDGDKTSAYKVRPVRKF